MNEDDGKVIAVGDAEVEIDGLGRAFVSELIALPRGGIGMVTALRSDRVVVARLDRQPVHVGELARCTRRAAEVPVGARVRGRILDPIGRTFDGRGTTGERTRRIFGRPLERVRRDLHFGEPVWTGWKRIDLFGRVREGERRAIRGPKGSGKTRLAIDMAIEQARLGSHCVFVTIGRDETQLARLAKTFADEGALEAMTIVSAPALAPPALAALAPFSACAIAEQIRDDRERALLIFDDVDRHAEAFARSPLASGGALEARWCALLDRACIVRHERGSGALTCVILLDTGTPMLDERARALDASCDGAIVLQPSSTGLAIDLAHTFPVQRFGAPLKGWGGKLAAWLVAHVKRSAHAPSRRPLSRVEQQLEAASDRLLAILDQSRRMPVEEQVAAVYAVVSGMADEVPREMLATYESQLLAHLRETQAPLLRTIREIGGVSGDMKETLATVLQRFRARSPYEA
jgi:F-type H+-transporting ATPase subunit alpha